MSSNLGTVTGGSLMSKYGGSALTFQTKLTRHTRNQRTIDSIKNDTARMKRDLDQITKDIYDNVLEFHKSPGATNPKTIAKALKEHLWAPGGSPQKTDPGEPRKATKK